MAERSRDSNYSVSSKHDGCLRYFWRSGKERSVEQKWTSDESIWWWRNHEVRIQDILASWDGHCGWAWVHKYVQTCCMCAEGDVTPTGGIHVEQCSWLQVHWNERKHHSSSSSPCLKWKSALFSCWSTSRTCRRGREKTNKMWGVPNAASVVLHYDRLHKTGNCRPTCVGSGQADNIVQSQH